MPRKYEPQKWNKNIYTRYSHNCLAFFLQNINHKMTRRCKSIYKRSKRKGTRKNSKLCIKLKPQPGYFSGYPKIKPKDYTCKTINKRLLADTPDIFKTNFEKSCPRTYHKGALVVDPKKMYHFYLENKKGSWSHKDGEEPATNRDAEGKLIKDPKKAARNYRGQKLNYSKFCSYYCVPSRTNMSNKY
jgi:hypothetical protein